jgi:hypothetical protein
MKIMNERVKLPSYLLMVFVFLFMTILFTYLFFNSSNSKWASIFGGVAASFFVAEVQFLCQIYEYLKLRKYEQMGVIDVLKERRDRDYYGKLIQKSKSRILVMGVTASRFFDDFANKSVSGNSELIEAVRNGVEVKVLLPKRKYLQSHDQANFDALTLKLSQDDVLSGKCQIKYFDHFAAHSLVQVDDVCIVGPIFKDLRSKNTPAIVLKTDSVVAKPYIDNFNKEWNSADDSFT